MNEKDDINDKIVVLKSRNKNKNEHNENPSLNISPQQMNEDTMKYLVRIKNKKKRRCNWDVNKNLLSLIKQLVFLYMFL